ACAAPAALAARPRHLPEDEGANQMVPAAGAADLHLMHGELLLHRRKAFQLLDGTGGAGHPPQPLTEDPGYECQRLLAADGADDLAHPAVESRRAQQVRAGVADLVHAGAAAG